MSIDDYTEHWRNLPTENARKLIRGNQVWHISRTIAINNIVEIGGSVIECGIGSGVDAERIIERGVNYTGIDISPAIVENIKEKSLGTILNGSITDIPFENDTFSTAYTRHVLEHLPPTFVNKAISELVRVASNQVVITFFISLSEGETHGNWTENVGDWEGAGVWENHCSIVDVKNIISSKFGKINIVPAIPDTALRHGFGACEDNWVLIARN